MNIMTNALEAISAGSGTRLTVRAEAVAADWVAVTFEDDGPGFVEPDRVFDAFYTTKPVGGGTGLGLSLVQRFITEGGGDDRGGEPDGRRCASDNPAPSGCPATGPAGANRDRARLAGWSPP